MNQSQLEPQQIAFTFLIRQKLMDSHNFRIHFRERERERESFKGVFYQQIALSDLRSNGNTFVMSHTMTNWSLTIL